ncbi:MAG: DUF1826 domain-containing protein [Chryseobacterium sp.]|nr:MAG: DUF1826 domain-containing protein [Chryseobacterium sp.]
MNSTFSNNDQIQVVQTFSELITTAFQGAANSLCWFRDLSGDFKEIVSKLTLEDNITEVSIEDLLALDLSDNGKIAREIILKDLKLLTDFGASPSLNLLKNYERDEEFEFISTDVYSFHVDRSPTPTDTFLCTYHGPASDIIANDQAIQKIQSPEIRRKLKELHTGSEAEFEAFLKDNFFDLHYLPKTDAQPVNLGSGHLWRLAVDHPEQKVSPCIHRAPVENDGEYRLLLIC